MGQCVMVWYGFSLTTCQGIVWYGVVLWDLCTKCSVVWLRCGKMATNGLEGSILLCLLFSETSTEARTMDIGEIHSRVDNWGPFQGLFMRGGEGLAEFRCF